MRLTDRPRSLAEMKPEVKWPAQLQAVMDRALSRDAATRYTSAAEFGHDFAKAIERMPQTIATEGGTSIINTPSMPQTAIAPAPTHITGATTAKAVQPRPKSRGPVMIGGAAVAVGALIVFGVLRANGPAGTASPPVTTTALPNGAAGGTTAAKAAGDSVPSTTARALGQKAAPVPRADALSPAAIKAEIAAIRELTLGEQTAAEAVRRAEAILPMLRTGDDSAEVLLQVFDAYVTRNDSSRSCNALKRIGTRGNSIVRESVVSGLLNC